MENRIIAVINHELYGSITSDKEVLDTQNELLRDADEMLINTIKDIDSHCFNEKEKAVIFFNKVKTKISNSRPVVDEYPQNGIMKIKLVADE